MKILNFFSFILISGIAVYSNANVDPKAYIIQTPAYNPNSFLQGMEIGARASKARREQAERLKMEEREESYKAELKNFYDNPSTVSRTNLTRVMFLYPEFSDNTSKIIDAMDKAGLLKD